MNAPWHFGRSLWDRACAGPALPIIAAVGAFASAGGAVASGIAQQKAADYNAAVDRNNAIQAQEASDAQASVVDQQTQQKLGQQKAEYAASGVDVNTGSPLDVMSSTAATGKLDALTVRYGGQVRANSDQQAAALATSQGSADLTSGIVSGGSTLLTGAAKLGKDEGWTW